LFSLFDIDIAHRGLGARDQPEAVRPNEPIHEIVKSLRLASFLWRRGQRAYRRLLWIERQKPFGVIPADVPESKNTGV